MSSVKCIMPCVYQSQTALKLLSKKWPRALHGNLCLYGGDGLPEESPRAIAVFRAARACQSETLRSWRSTQARVHVICMYRI